MRLRLALTASAVSLLSACFRCWFGLRVRGECAFPFRPFRALHSFPRLAGLRRLHSYTDSAV